MKNTTTVKQLINILQTLPQGLPVFVTGYEDGYENFHPPFIEKVVHQPDNPYYDGEYQTAAHTKGDALEAFILARKVKD